MPRHPAWPARAFPRSTRYCCTAASGIRIDGNHTPRTATGSGTPSAAGRRSPPGWRGGTLAASGQPGGLPIGWTAPPPPRSEPRIASPKSVDKFVGECRAMVFGRAVSGGLNGIDQNSCKTQPIDFVEYPSVDVVIQLTHSTIPLNSRGGASAGGQIRPAALDLHAGGCCIREHIQLLHPHPRQVHP